MSGEQVLVTGGSGFLGSRMILKLLAAGHRVRTSVRSPDREPDVRTMLRAGGAEPGDALSFAIADLTSDAGWAAAVAGRAYVLHVASPFPPRAPRHADDVVVPARDGTLRVLRAARDAGVRRVVVTSSFAAVGYGHPPTDRAFTEEDWTDTATVPPYIRSKAVAERAAWDFVERTGGPELAVVNPVGIFGPVLGPDFPGPIELVRMLLTGAVPGTPRLAYSVVDVRDAADLHLLAMAGPAAAGERFIGAADGGVMSMNEIAHALRDRLGPAAARVPTGELPDDAVAGVPELRQLVPDLGVVRRSSNEKAKRVLGWRPGTDADAVVATAESLLRLGLVPTGGAGTGSGR